MALVVGTNSWVSVAEADTYFTDRVGASDWFDLDESPATPGANSKETFLISAFYWLFDDQGFNLPQVSDDPIIKRAQEEAALFLMKYSLSYEERQAKIAAGVERFKNSKWEEARLLNIDFSPPTIIASVPFIAPVSPPLTGASSISTPLSFNRVANVFVADGEIVLISITTLFFFAP